MSNAYRKAGAVFAVAAALSLSPALVRPALAFKLFGVTLWGEKDAVAEVIDPVRYKAVLTTDGGDEDLADTLEETSGLVQDQETPVSGDLGVVVKARDDRDRLIATLYEQSRYGGIVDIRIDGQPLDDLPPSPVFNRDQPVEVSVRIDPGPVFTLGKVTFEGDAATLDPTVYGLEAGKPAGSLAVLKAGERIVDDLKTGGRPLAKLTNRALIADHKTSTVDVTLAATGGPVADIGAIGVKGEERVDPDFIRTYARINEGKPYSPDNLRKAGDRLRKLGVFSSVTVREADTLDANGTIPVNIEVSEAKRRYYGFGASVSTLDGFGLQGYWGHRNLFGRAETLRVEGAISRIGETTDYKDLDYSAGVLFSKPGFILPAATLNASLKVKTEHPDSYKANTVTAATGIDYEISDTDTVSGGGEVAYSDTQDAYGNNQYLTLSLPFEYTRDTRDNKLDPTSGFNATISAKPSYEALQSTFFTSFEGSVSGYKSLGSDDKIVLAAKFSAGTLLGASNLEDIPATRRFYAGGGGSVRGYSYQEISPYNGNGDALGGRSYAVASFETRVKVTETIGLVPFIDVGNVTGKQYPDFSDIRAGAGVGIRYATPFGPLRLDVAMPLQPYEGGSRYGIYAGIGQSF